jgi:hypothetical protein
LPQGKEEKQQQEEEKEEETHKEEGDGKQNQKTYHTLAIEKLLGKDRCQTPQHVMARIYHHHLSTQTGSRHHFFASQALACLLAA